MREWVQMQVQQLSWVHLAVPLLAPECAHASCAIDSGTHGTTCQTSGPVSHCESGRAGGRAEECVTSCDGARCSVHAYLNLVSGGHPTAS